MVDGRKVCEVGWMGTVPPSAESLSARLRQRRRSAFTHRAWTKLFKSFEVVVKQTGITAGSAPASSISANGGKNPNGQFPRTSLATRMRQLKKSLKLQESLRKRAQKNFRSLERSRHCISGRLQEETVQTLVGIQVQLLSLRAAAREGKPGILRELASTQRLITDSMTSIRRFARELSSRITRK